jgi:putative ABC transport system permease protein
MSSLLDDVRYALRSLALRPGFSTAVVLVLALGLGAVTAVFSVLDRALMRPLAVDGNGARWVRVLLARDGGTRLAENLSYPLFEDVRDRAGAFDRVLAHNSLSFTLNVGGEVERVDGGAVSAGFFSALGLALPLGREILPVEDRPGAAERVVILSHALWQRRFGGDRGVLGRLVSLNSVPFTVVGVAPAGFLGPVRGASEAAWIPLAASSTAGGPDVFTRRTVSWLDVMARLAPGSDRTRAQAGLDVLGRQLARDSLFPADSRLVVAEGAAGLTYLVRDLQRPMALLFGASVVVLLIAGANLAGLLLARAATRQRELAIRLALGASRFRIARLFVTEGLVLALLGAAAGLVVASWLADAAPALRTMFGQELQLSGGLDLRSAVVSGTLALVLAAMIAASPVAWASSLSPSSGLKEGFATAGGVLRGRLVVVQLALAVVLVAGGFLLGFTTRRLAAVDPGYRPEGVLLAEVDLAAAGYKGEEAANFWRTVLAELRGSALVGDATVAQTVTPSPGGMHYDHVLLDGSAFTPDQVDFDLNLVGPHYFGTLGVPVLAGRDFSEQDRRGSERVAVVNREMARRYWGDQSPLGRRIWLAGDTTQPPVTVVGIAADGKYRSLKEDPLPVVFLSALAQPPMTGTLLVRVRPGASTGTLGPLIREVVRRLDASLPVYDLRPLSSHLALASATERLLSFLAGLYAVLATLLAAVGLFGLLSYHVARGTHEIGIRLALGAEPARIRHQVVRQGLGYGVAGMIGGLVLSLAAGHWITALLYGISPLDPRILLGVAGLMLLVVLGASWWPAARAARVDPMVALRAE